MPTLLLKTKLYIPAPRAEFVVRPSLNPKLDQVLTHKLTLLSAPAGYGKTTLMAEWINAQTTSSPSNFKRDTLARQGGASRPPQVAWFSLDEGDNDSNRFWSYVTAA